MSKLAEFINKYQFAAVRIVISLYLAYFFVSMFEQRELVGNLANPQSAVSHTLILGVPLLALILCILLFLGAFVPQVSLALLICYQVEFIFLPVPKEVQTAYISIILLIFAFFGKNDKRVSFLSTRLNDISNWHLILFLAVYFGFSVSGLSKFFYEPWLNGEAINYLCNTSQIGNLNGTWLCSIIPKTLLGYFVLFVEISSLPLALFRKTRPIAWFLNTGLHLCTPIFLYVWPVSVGVLLMQMILFDCSWLKSQFFLKRDKHFVRQNQNY